MCCCFCGFFFFFTTLLPVKAVGYVTISSHTKCIHMFTYEPYLYHLFRFHPYLVLWIFFPLRMNTADGGDHGEDGGQHMGV